MFLLTKTVLQRGEVSGEGFIYVEMPIGFEEGVSVNQKWSKRKSDLW